MTQVYEASRGQIERFAHRVRRRLHAAGARTVQLEDIVGELNLAWCIARDSFDASKGVPFAPYLQLGMTNHINRWAQGQVSHGRHRSLDFQMSEDGDTVHEIVPSAEPSPEDEIEGKTARAFALAQLSPRARQFVDLLDRPTDEILEILEGMQAKAAFARSRGINAVAPTDVTAPLVLDFIGAGRNERRGIYREIKSVSQKINQC